MKKLFIISNSIDSTSDVLISLCNKYNVEHFRWNIDLWQSYQITVSSTESKIEINSRSIDILNDDYVTIWRKPFINLADISVPIPSTEKKFIQEQFNSWLQYLCSIFRKRNALRLVEPLGDRILPKLTQLSIAKKYFKVPEYCFSTKSSILESTEIITKPLGDPTISDGKILYTTKVKKQDLFYPYPWFTQSGIIGGSDVTCVHILGRNYFFKSEFQRSANNLDWRTEINSENQSRWVVFETIHLEILNEATNQFMNDCGLKYGRLDFILSDDELFFLECNPNGQFGWLDHPVNLSLHKSFFDAIQSEKSILKISI